MKFARGMTGKLLAALRSGGFILLLGITAAQVSATQHETNEDLAPRTLEVLDVGCKLPIEIVAVRNLRKKKHWLRDLEIEIRNVSTRPIYGVYVTLLLPDDKRYSGAQYGCHLEYGRSKLLHPGGHASSGDKPIEPGQTVTIRVEEPLWHGYEHHIMEEDVPEQASYNVRMIVVGINFGDGTGFFNGGVPYPGESPYVARPQRYVRIPPDSK